MNEQSKRVTTHQANVLLSRLFLGNMKTWRIGQKTEKLSRERREKHASVRSPLPLIQSNFLLQRAIDRSAHISIGGNDLRRSAEKVLLVLEFKSRFIA